MNNKCAVCKSPTSNKVLCDKCRDMVMRKNEKLTLPHFIKSIIDFCLKKNERN